MYISISTYYILPRVNTPKSQVEKSECRTCKSFELSEFTQMVHVLPVHCNRQLVILRAHNYRFISLNTWFTSNFKSPCQCLSAQSWYQQNGEAVWGGKTGLEVVRNCQKQCRTSATLANHSEMLGRLKVQKGLQKLFVVFSCFSYRITHN